MVSSVNHEISANTDLSMENVPFFNSTLTKKFYISTPSSSTTSLNTTSSKEAKEIESETSLTEKRIPQKAGKCYVFNNKFFDQSSTKASTRLGTEMDSQKLEQLFKHGFDFEYIEYSDLTVAETNKILKNGFVKENEENGIYPAHFQLNA